MGTRPSARCTRKSIPRDARRIRVCPPIHSVLGKITHAVRLVFSADQRSTTGRCIGQKTARREYWLLAEKRNISRDGSPPPRRFFCRLAQVYRHNGRKATIRWARGKSSRRAASRKRAASSRKRMAESAIGKAGHARASARSQKLRTSANQRANSLKNAQRGRYTARGAAG